MMDKLWGRLYAIEIPKDAGIRNTDMQYQASLDPSRGAKHYG
jgi:hypothetical protein